MIGTRSGCACARACGSKVRPSDRALDAGLKDHPTGRRPVRGDPDSPALLPPASRAEALYPSGTYARGWGGIYPDMIRKLKSGEYRLYSRKKDASTGKRRNLGTFSSLEKAKQHEREVQYFKKH